jgi:hypothetical protein
MLALYDSEGNQLAKRGALDQTALYNSLLVRFINRERLKGEQGQQFHALPSRQRDELISGDLRRLGVAAIGMLNRRALHITKVDLEQDLKYFSMQREVPGGLFTQ